MRDLVTDPIYVNWKEGVSEHLVSLHFLSLVNKTSNVGIKVILTRVRVTIFVEKQ